MTWFYTERLKSNIYTASGSTSPAKKEKSGVGPCPLLILIILCSVSKNSEITSLPSELHGRHACHCPNHTRTTRPVWTKISSAHLPPPVLRHHILLNTHFSYTCNLQSHLKPQDRVPQSTQNKMTKLPLSHARTVLSFQALENQNRREECSYSSILTGGKSQHYVLLRSQNESATLGNFEIRRKNELLRPSLLTVRIRACTFRYQRNNFVSTAECAVLFLMEEIKTMEATPVVMN